MVEGGVNGVGSAIGIGCDKEALAFVIENAGETIREIITIRTRNADELSLLRTVNITPP